MPRRSINGTIDDDVLSGTPRRDIVHGLDGNDEISGSAGPDLLYGDGGNDYLIGNAGNDTLYGGAGNDVFQLDSGGRDLIFGGADYDVVNLNNTATSVLGQADGTFGVFENGRRTATLHEIELIFGGDGDDYIDATDYNGEPITLIGMNGNDTLIGSEQSDSLSGFSGTDSLFGGGGNDLLGGDLGDDSLYGEAGNDTLGGDIGINPDPSHDYINGGSGTDRVVYHDAYANYDVESADGDATVGYSTDGKSDFLEEVEEIWFQDGIYFISTGNFLTYDQVPSEHFNIWA